MSDSRCKICGECQLFRWVRLLSINVLVYCYILVRNIHLLNNGGGKRAKLVEKIVQKYIKKKLNYKRWKYVLLF